MQRRLVVLLAAMTVLSPVVGVVGAAPVAPTGADAPVQTTDTLTTSVSDTQETERSNRSAGQDDAPPDPAEDVIGWEDGYWYNESVTVDRSDGLNDSELAAVVSRGMARVEQIRKLEFQQRVPVEIITRDQYRDDNAERFENTTDPFRRHQNAKFEALFFVNESTDAIEVQESTRSATVLGFYSPSDDAITIVSENTTSPKMDEITLSQELFHALQGQVFDIYDSEAYPGTTREDANAIRGVIEGDGNYVDTLYNQRCGEEWDCLLPQNEGGGGGGDVNIGLNVLQLAPYTEGPEWVQQVREEGGWEAVNDLYDNPPESTEQYIDPETYPDEERVDVAIEDRSSEAWEILELEGNDSVNYAEFGEAGVFTMLWFASYEKTVDRQAPSSVAFNYIELFEFKTPQRQELKDIGGYNYSHPTSSGYAGDRLLPYVSGQNASLDELGYVWAIQWDTPEDAQQFADAYREVLDYRGADAVEGRQGTFRIPDGEEFADAFYVDVDGDTVTIVNGPTVEDLPQITEGAAPEVETTTTETTTTDDGGDTTTDGGDTTTDTDTETEDEEQPGFGAVVAVLALLGALLVLRRRD